MFSRITMGETMKILLTIVGLLVLAMGLIWAGQGLGIVTWHPAGMPQSFMVNNREWIYIDGAGRPAHRHLVAAVSPSPKHVAG
jgi:hypothetical protein